MAFWMRSSVRVSTLDVASSRISSSRCARSARDGQQLLLAGGDGRGIAADDRIVALWKRADKVVTVRLVAGADDLLARRVRLAEGHVFGNRAAEEPRVLQDHAEAVARGGAGIVRDIMPAQ